MANVISLIPDEQSTRLIQTYLTENASLIGKPREKFHSTLLYTETFPIFRRDKIINTMRETLPIVLNPARFSLDTFDGDVLVLKYHNEEFLDMNRKLLSEGLRQAILEWPDLNESEGEVLRASSNRRQGPIYELNPHISLARDFNGDTARLPKFPYQLTLTDISWKHIY